MKGKRAFSDPRSLNAFSLALCALNDEEETLYVSRWEKKEKKKKRKGKKYEVERERSGDGRRCCWWWWRCVVDGERNELQDGIAVGSSDEKPSKAKREGGGGEDCRETGKNERHGGEFGRKVKESNLCEIIRCRSACWNCFVKICDNRNPRYNNGVWCNLFLLSFLHR